MGEAVHGRDGGPPKGCGPRRGVVETCASRLDRPLTAGERAEGGGPPDQPARCVASSKYSVGVGAHALGLGMTLFLSASIAGTRNAKRRAGPRGN